MQKMSARQKQAVYARVFLMPQLNEKAMKIGNATLKGNLILAPLAGYTDKAFRQIATIWGADACVTEMVSAEGLARGGEKSQTLLERFPGEDDLIMQLFGPDADPFERALETLLSFHPTIIDINCGCPVPKVVKTGAGSALMQDPDKIYRIVSYITKHTEIPVSVKFRLGWIESEKNYLSFADAAAEGGASALTMHARTRAQGYSGKADWTELKTLREHVPAGIKVFGSGDVFTPEDAVRMLVETGVDGVMFARGAIGNPFIFQQTKQLISTGHYDPIGIEIRKKTILEHIRLMAEYSPDCMCTEIRKHLVGYVKGIPGASAFKKEAMTASSIEAYEKAVNLL